MTLDDHHDDKDEGTMDTSQQEKTFDGFLRMVSIAAGLIVVVLVFLALVNG